MAPAWHDTISPAGLSQVHALNGGSSNGRTTDSGSVNRGSNPLPPARNIGRNCRNIPKSGDQKSPSTPRALFAFLIKMNVASGWIARAKDQVRLQSRNSV